MSPEAAPLPTITNPRDGTKIPLRVTGAGEPLLLVHGWTLDHRAFDPQDPLAGRLRLMSLDRRGAGQSTAAPDLGAETDDLLAILDVLEMPRAHLLGVSQGARVALRFAALHPERLRSLILQGAALDGFQPALEDTSGVPLAHYADLARRGEMATLRAEWLAHPLMSSETLSGEQQQALEEMVADYSGDDLRSELPAASAIPDLEARLRALSVPTLVITGERETAARRAHAQRLVEIIPGAREAVLPDCGHLSNFSRPEAYNRAVLEFIAAL
jgi:pimeloyl-ACP methyl ester carboxylesterase